MSGSTDTLGGVVRWCDAPLLCACGSAQVLAVDPGSEGEEMVLMGHAAVIRRGVPPRAVCVACWVSACTSTADTVK